MVKTQRGGGHRRCQTSARSIFGGVLSAVNGESVLQGASFLGARLDQRIASDLVTLVDDGTRPKGMASAPFDGEGVPTQKRVIVDKGVLQRFHVQHHRREARRRREHRQCLPRRLHQPAGDRPAQLLHGRGRHTAGARSIKATKVGLWLKEVTGYGINAVNGNFSGGASGLWIENGQVAFPVKGLTIAGTADQMLNGIDLVGTDLDLNRSFAGPTFRIREMQIGGE